MNEIEEKMKIKKIDSKKRRNNSNRKNKKINILSNTFFNENKKKIFNKKF